jgi:Xaa-Pro dipeptidase
MENRVPESELRTRMERFRLLMDREYAEWEVAAVFGRINQYYFTGTMQDGVLIIPRDGEAVFWVRRSIERAQEESFFPEIRPMGSFREAAAGTSWRYGTLHLDTEVVPLALLQRFRKHFPINDILPLDRQVAKVRSVKSPFELALLEQAGRIHCHVLEVSVVELLQEGMSEADLASELFSVMVREGHHGIVRFGMFGIEIVTGHIGFGESSLHPTSFDGASGCLGIAPGAPVLGSRDRTLQKGDLVFIDTGCGVEGYHTDKTMTYMFGRSLPDEAIAIQRQCVDIQDDLATLLKPGISPEEIYSTIIEGLSLEFLENFMGFENRRVNFLGHGVGLQVDEMPVIARGFDEPLEEGMVIALEPKKGIRGIGMVGIENTFVVTPQGGRSITGNSPGLIPVY